MTYAELQKMYMDGGLTRAEAHRVIMAIAQNMIRLRARSTRIRGLGAQRLRRPSVLDNQRVIPRQRRQVAYA